MRITPGTQFASDNTAGICPEAWSAMAAAMQGSAPSYGTDRWTERACDAIRSVLEFPDAEIFFVFNGTAANSLALAACCQSYHGVICHEFAHIETDECGAPEFFSNGSKLLLASGAHGKLDPQAVELLVTRRTDLHYPHPRVVSLSQSTELGTVYTPAEIAAVGAVARRHQLYLHMDGARFANALAATQQRTPGSTAADLTWRAGVDVLCFGGTKNGMQSTEAVVFFNRALAQDFEFRCKQAGQLASKMRFHSSQWLGALEHGAWLRHAAHANAMAQRLAQGLLAVPGVSLSQPVEANAVFARLTDAAAQALGHRGWHFYAFIGAGQYRFMCSWETQPEHIDALLADLRAAA
ncbi:MAG TPA: low specificity L-threonine aldolase [Steroidobacteraceae bacterium]|nr:low specificity L-threonine aldolase [Steroidobacteraceae bacterium]